MAPLSTSNIHRLNAGTVNRQTYFNSTTVNGQTFCEFYYHTSTVNNSKKKLIGTSSPVKKKKRRRKKKKRIICSKLHKEIYFLRTIYINSHVYMFAVCDICTCNNKVIVHLACDKSECLC